MIIYKILWVKTDVEHSSAGQEILIFDQNFKLIIMLVNLPLDPAISQMYPAMYPFFSLNTDTLKKGVLFSLYLSIGCIQHKYVSPF